ncbi:MAG: hypothetical protein KAJ28_10080 [Flavobacteriaceae bacterium]|nr:hypothetical protein [Flavobacteriaceae bacterium]
MKALKITLLLAIFCLTFSGQSYDTENTKTNDTYKTNKNEFKQLAEVVKKTKLPGQA